MKEIFESKTKWKYVKKRSKMKFNFAGPAFLSQRKRSNIQSICAILQPI